MPTSLIIESLTPPFKGKTLNLRFQCPFLQNIEQLETAIPERKPHALAGKGTVRLTYGQSE